MKRDTEEVSSKRGRTEHLELSEIGDFCHREEEEEEEDAEARSKAVRMREACMAQRETSAHQRHPHPRDLQGRE